MLNGCLCTQIHHHMGSQLPEMDCGLVSIHSEAAINNAAHNPPCKCASPCEQPAPTPHSSFTLECGPQTLRGAGAQETGFGSGRGFPWSSPSLSSLWEWGLQRPALQSVPHPTLFPQSTSSSSSAQVHPHTCLHSHICTLTVMHTHAHTRSHAHAHLQLCSHTCTFTKMKKKPFSRAELLAP